MSQVWVRFLSISSLPPPQKKSPLLLVHLTASMAVTVPVTPLLVSTSMSTIRTLCLVLCLSLSKETPSLAVLNSADEFALEHLKKMVDVYNIPRAVSGLLLRPFYQLLITVSALLLPAPIIPEYVSLPILA